MINSNGRVFWQVKYKEEYNDLKKYVYFPYHITPQYEKDVAARKNLDMVNLIVTILQSYSISILNIFQHISTYFPLVSKTSKNYFNKLPAIEKGF